MRSSEQTSKIDHAVAIIQGKIEGIKKNKTVKIDGERASWESGYLTLAALDAVVRPLLRDAGVAVYQGGDYIPGGGGHVLVTRLALDGEWVESFFPIRSTGDSAQKTGGGISFARRWGLCGMLNIIPDDMEEKQGYKDARLDARPARKSSAPAGLAARLDALRRSTSVAAFVGAAGLARADHSTGDAAAAVEKAIGAWLVNAFNASKTGEQFSELRECVARAQPRGSEVHDAIQRAHARVIRGSEP